jgi:hypothetical protein
LNETVGLRSPCRKAGDLRGSGPVKVQPWERSAGLGFPVKFLECFERDFVRFLLKVRPMKLIGTEQVVNRLALDRGDEDEEESGAKQAHRSMIGRKRNSTLHQAMNQSPLI